ncbi:hypothetical protein DFP72DRAFT_1139965 [Ephemerocybe angulata]|uniref:Uncharacterized protein n=1 Tax=Ephemerocybe angulata TaxID=980116 RepID=A0A8H6M2M1_9AGAR|nr:hypothetical protein DFP72DRAFT_1139965 [Tulosesus angulatus]
MSNSVEMYCTSNLTFGVHLWRAKNRFKRVHIGGDELGHHTSPSYQFHKLTHAQLTHYSTLDYQHVTNTSPRDRRRNKTKEKLPSEVRQRNGPEYGVDDCEWRCPVFVTSNDGRLRSRRRGDAGPLKAPAECKRREWVNVWKPVKEDTDLQEELSSRVERTSRRTQLANDNATDLSSLSSTKRTVQRGREREGEWGKGKKGKWGMERNHALRWLLENGLSAERTRGMSARPHRVWRVSGVESRQWIDYVRACDSHHLPLLPKEESPSEHGLLGIQAVSDIRWCDQLGERQESGYARPKPNTPRPTQHSPPTRHPQAYAVTLLYYSCLVKGKYQQVNLYRTSWVNSPISDVGRRVQRWYMNPVRPEAYPKRWSRSRQSPFPVFKSSPSLAGHSGIRQPP